MSTNTLLKVEGTAWAVSNNIEKALKGKCSSEEIVSSLGLDYTVSAHHVQTDIEDPVKGYFGMYRDDNREFLGIVRSENPKITHNVDTFKSIEPLMDDQVLKPVVANSYLGGKQLFGCFQLNQSFKVLDDDFNHYFVVVNDHLRPDGNLTVINTPIRIACMNAMSAVLNRAHLKFKIPATIEHGDFSMISKTIINSYMNSVRMMQKSAQKMVDTKISRKSIDIILDELFPFIPESEKGTINHERANETVSMQREAFVNCLAADNLSNYEGTMWQVFNALTDYSTHYFRNADKAFDLQHRMTLLPGMNPEATTEALKVSKFVNNFSKYAMLDN